MILCEELPLHLLEAKKGKDYVMCGLLETVLQQESLHAENPVFKNFKVGVDNDKEIDAPKIWDSEVWLQMIRL